MFSRSSDIGVQVGPDGLLLVDLGKIAALRFGKPDFIGQLQRLRGFFGASLANPDTLAAKR